MATTRDLSPLRDLLGQGQDSAKTQDERLPLKELLARPINQKASPSTIEETKEPIFQKQDSVGGNEFAGFAPGAGQGTPFDFHIVTPKLAVKETDFISNLLPTPSNLLNGVKKTFNVVSGIAEGVFNSMTDMFDFKISAWSDDKKTAPKNALFPGMYKESSDAKDIASALSFAAAAGTLAFAPYSVKYEAMANISPNPIDRLKFGIVNEGLGLLGQAGAILGGKGIESLSISDDAKKILSGPAEVAGSFILPLVGAKVGEGAIQKYRGKTKISTKKIPGAEGEAGMTALASEPTFSAKIIGLMENDPITRSIRGMQDKAVGYFKKMLGAGSPDNADTAKKALNQATKEVPVEMPGEMKIIKTDEAGNISPAEPIKVYTNQKLVLQNFIKGREDINYKTVPSIGKDPDGNPITARFEWDYKNQRATMYVTKSSTAEDLAHELGHYYDKTLSAKVDQSMSQILSDYAGNKDAVRETLAAYAVNRLQGNATPKQINAKVDSLVGNFDTQIGKLAKGETRGANDRFAEAVKKVITDPAGARKVAPDFSDFVQFSLKETGIIGREVKNAAGIKTTTEIKGMGAGKKGIFVDEQIFSGRQIAKEAKELGSDQGGLSDFTLNKIRSEEFKNETAKISDLAAKDQDLADYIKSGKIRSFEGEPFNMRPIVSSSGEVLDGYNRIAQLLKDGKTEVDILRGIQRGKKTAKTGQGAEEFLKKNNVYVDRKAIGKDTHGTLIKNKTTGELGVRISDKIDLKSAEGQKTLWHEAAHILDGEGNKISAENSKILLENKDYISKSRNMMISIVGHPGGIEKIVYKGSPDFQKYVNQPEELFAEGFSEFKTNPESMKADAPKLYDFYNQLETKPAGQILKSVAQEKTGVSPFKGKGITTPAFNEAKLNAPQDVIDTLNLVAEKNAQFSKDRRATTLDEMKSFSLKYLGDENLYKTLPAEIRTNLGKMKAAEQTMVDLATDLRDTMKATDIANSTDAEISALRDKLLNLEKVTAAFSGARTESSHLFASLKGEISPGENNILRELFTDLKKAGLETVELDKFFREKERVKKEALQETRAEGAIGVWYSFMLSGPGTFIKNAVSTGGSVVGEVIATGLRNPKELPAGLAALWSGMRDGWGMAGEVVKGNRPGAAEMAKFTHGVSKIPYEFKGKAAIFNKMRIVGRLLAASDTVFNEGLRQMELTGLKNDPPTPVEMQRLGEQRAKREGFRGDAIKIKGKEYATKTPEILIGDLANQFALKGTYNNDPIGLLGVVSRKVSEATRDVPALKIVAPFTRVVANVFSRAIDFTPYGFTRLKTGQGFSKLGSKIAKEMPELTARQRNQQFTRAIAGTVFMAAGAALAAAGNLSGNGPNDYNKKQQLLDQGWRANSVKIGNTWIPYVNLGPLALPLSLVANANDALAYGQLKDADVEKRLMAGVAGAMSSMFSMSFLSGMNSFMDALSTGNPNKVKNIMSSTLTGAVPNLVKQVGRLFDPTVYDTSSTWEAILSNMRIAGVAGVKPKLNVFGDPVQGDRLTQLTPSQMSADPVMKFLGDNQLWITQPSKTTQIRVGREQRSMTEEEYYEYVQKSGPKIKKEIQRSMSTILREKNKDDRQKKLNDIVSEQRQRVKSDIERKAK